MKHRVLTSFFFFQKQRMATLTDEKAFKKLQTEEYFRQFYAKNTRPDGRKGLVSSRPVTISVGSISTADGSSIVKQGETVVVCGIKLELAHPSNDNPKMGYIVPNLVLSPACHAQFKPGAPCEEAQVLSAFLNEVILNSKVFPLENLCIAEGKWVWSVYIDLTCFNYTGNLLDASVKALTAALRDLKVPEVSFEKNEDDSDRIEVSVDKALSVNLGPMPVACSVAIFEDSLLLDPTDEEEMLAETVITIVLTGDGEVCHVHKAGGIAVSQDVIQQSISLAKKNFKSVEKFICATSNEH